MGHVAPRKSVPMLRPLDRTRRDGPLYPGATRTLRQCIDSQHLLVRIDTALDLAHAAEPLAAVYHAGGRPAIHPEIVLRALVLKGLYRVPSDRQLVERIAENLAWRWFCHLTLEDPVFDHSTLTVFLERAGAATLTVVLDRVNEDLAASGLLSPHTYLDASLIPTAATRRALEPRAPSDDPLEPNPEQGTWQERMGEPPTDDSPGEIRMIQYQDPEGRLTLSATDPAARWRTHRQRSVLGYAEHVLADRSGFILARRLTAANVEETEAALPLLTHLPHPVTTLAADTGYRSGAFRRRLHRLGITEYIPLGCNQTAGCPVGFVDHLDHLVCPQGQVLRPMLPTSDGRIRYRGEAGICRACPVRSTCVTPSRVAKAVWASAYRVELRRAVRMNETVRYAREQRRRQIVSEGIFAHLDSLGGKRARYRGVEPMDRRGVLAALAHNILKAMTKRRFWPRAASSLPHPARSRPLVPPSVCVPLCP